VTRVYTDQSLPDSVLCPYVMQALAVLMAYSMLPETPMFASPARSTLWNNMMVTIETLLLLVVAIRSFPVSVALCI
jgi:hypothetical protein